MEKVQNLMALSQEYRRRSDYYRDRVLSLPKEALKIKRLYFLLKSNFYRWLADEYDDIADDEFDRIGCGGK